MGGEGEHTQEGLPVFSIPEALSSLGLMPGSHTTRNVPKVVSPGTTVTAPA